jgi:predicted Zn-dependent peptidase
MKKILLLLVVSVISTAAFAQGKTETHRSADGKYTYQTVKGDLLGARIYTLKNGLTVYLSVMKNEPRVQTVIAVRAGSKHDPADATGLAHYLEHMLFKGTDKFGSLDPSKELPLLAEIEQRYETYRRTTDTTMRKKLYHEIDSVSGVAATYAIANEYDKMVGALGAKGTNASTWFDYTRYVNDIPSNQIRKWLSLESERFRNPQLRLFHTELEAVYEEKNRSIDDDNNSAFDKVLEMLFRNHTYGTQTTIGTVEHLKNPSLVRIKEYYAKNYVPNNMCIAISGDIDPDKVIVWIDEAFSWMQPKPITQPTFPPEAPFTSPVRAEVFGPDPESIILGFRFPGINTRETDLMRLTDMILSNSTAGLIDLDINQKQKALYAGTWVMPMVDYSVHFIYGAPLAGQSLESLEKLFVDELEKVKRGEFDDALLPAIINDLNVRQMRENESNNARANTMADAYISFTPWEQQASFIDRLASYTKKDVMEFAKKYYANNYAITYKRMGKRDVPKVTKPPITPVSVNRESESAFLKNLLATPAEDMKPRFLDYKNDIKTIALSKDVSINYLKNDENKLFTLYYKLDLGQRHDKKLGFALQYLDLLGTDTYSAEEVRKKLYALGLSFGVSASTDESYVYLSGLDKSFAEGVKFFEHLLANCKPDPEALEGLIEKTLKAREDAKKEKGTILFSGMLNYGMRGKKNPFNDILSESEMRSIKPEELTSKIHSLTSYKHSVMYYGPHSPDEVKNVLQKEHRLASTLRDVPNVPEYPFADTKDGNIYFVNFDMAQAEIIMLSKQYTYDKSMIPVQTLFNEYFGGGMSSIVFQEIRESKALAYASWSGFQKAQKKSDPNYLFTYIGTQADKLPDAMTAMNEILTELPKSDGAFTQAKDAIKKKIETERITRTGILMNYEAAKKLGLDYDIRRDIYSKTQTMSFDDIKKFQEQNIRGKKQTILVLGSRDKVDMDKLRQWGNVKELTLEEVFGY